VDETVEGWVGGLGIGVACTDWSELRRVPDKAWRLPNTYIVGYWGRIFANGEEQETSWRSDTLQPGARVGLMVLDGGLIVFVNGEVVVRADGLLGSPRGPFYPVVDVFAATRMITLNKNCRPPVPLSKVDAPEARSERSWSGASHSPPLHGYGGVSSCPTAVSRDGDFHEK